MGSPQLAQRGANFLHQQKIAKVQVEGYEAMKWLDKAQGYSYMYSHARRHATQDACILRQISHVQSTRSN